MTPAPLAPGPGRSIALVLGATALFSVMVVIIKWLGPFYPVVALVFSRCFFALFPVLPLLMRHGLIAALRSAQPAAQALRCALGIVGMTMNFYAFTIMPLADVVALGFTVPLFATALSIPVLGEKVGLRRWSAVAVGFVGVLLIVRPGGGHGWAALVPLAASVFHAGATVLTRQVLRTDRSETTVFWFMFASAAVTGAALPAVWTPPGWGDLGLMVLMGFIGGVAQVMHTSAYRGASVAVLAPFDYSAMLWALAWGYLIWAEVPDLWTALGALIVIAAGLYVLNREIALGRRLQAPAP